MYLPSDIDKLVYRKINEFFPADRVLCNLGWVSLKNPGLKYRPEYLNAFNFATEYDEIDYIQQFTRDANLDVIRNFYRQTNGMRLFGDDFCVHGVLFHRYDFVGLDFNCVALDFSSHGGYALPKYSPENGFLIGGSFRQKDGNTFNLHDIVTKSGEIVGGFFDESPEVTDRFHTIPDWLSARVEGAAIELQQKIRLTHH